MDLFQNPAAGRSPELTSAYGGLRGAFVSVALISCLLNILYLTGSFFMLEVYDRVIPSRSLPTLVGLCILALVLYAAQGAMDVLRGRILIRIGGALSESLSKRAFQVSRQAASSGKVAADIQPLRDLEHIRSFVSGMGPGAFIDLPWMPFYLFLCFVFHPLIGITALGGAAVLVIITFFTENLTRRFIKTMTTDASSCRLLADVNTRHAETIQVLGMGDRLGTLWCEVEGRYAAKQQRLSDITGGLSSFSKVFRMLLQSGVLAIGAFLVVRQEASAGIIIASSIIVSRSLAPVEQTVAHWKGFLRAFQGWRGLNRAFLTFATRADFLQLPNARSTLTVENLSVGPPGAGQPVVSGVSFGLSAGQGLGIIGPSASGKSSLVRALVGGWTPYEGVVRLDGAELNQWHPENLGANIGYLPQRIELFPGTIAQNIGRFESAASSEMIIAAAKTAGVHDMVLRMRNGYETRIGDEGVNLSAGQAQRVALARALYGDPFLVVLDEPNSNLDNAGEQALTQAILAVRFRKGIVIVVAHRPSVLTAISQVLVMENGRMKALDLKERILDGLPSSRVSARATT